MTTVTEDAPISDKPNTFRRLWRIIPKLLARRVDHEEVVEHAREGGLLSGRYLFMNVMACAIAMLGLLLSSPAVIIGAMLISPLMGPIVLMGFSLATLDLSALRRSIVSLTAGVASALAIAIIIVSLSPLTDPTPEIMSRTRPNFFDLLVAVFSGLAGGYAVINRKGETIVGVAIATALMPPLAVAGYGVALGAWSIAGGAIFLFFTNLLAISLTVSLLSRLYGFGADHGRDAALWQTILIFLVFGALSVPLMLSLRSIAYEATVATIVKSELLEPFESVDARISDIDFHFPPKGEIGIDATILTRNRVVDAETQLTRQLSSKLGRPVRFNLDQILVDEDREIERSQIMELADSSLAAPLRAEISQLREIAASASETRRIEDDLRMTVAIPLNGADINTKTKTAQFFLAASNGFSLAAWRAYEEGVQTRFSDWTIRLFPPVRELPLIYFDEADDTLGEDALETLEDCLWALDRWEVKRVEIVGYASTAGEFSRFDNRALAFRRAKSIADAVEAAGLSAVPVGEYRAFQQTTVERQQGRMRFQSALIRPLGE